ncbi:MAG: hypothetical protein V3V02_06205 [Rhizobiaceae bacterium]
MINSPEQISHIRTATMGFTGIICLAYASLVVITGQPQPMSPWIPGVAGVLTSIVIFGSFMAAGSKNAVMATDELYASQQSKAAQIGYWVALAMYPIFGLLIMQDLLSLSLAFPIMATLTGAAYLLPFAYLTCSRT